MGTLPEKRVNFVHLYVASTWSRSQGRSRQVIPWMLRVHDHEAQVGRGRWFSHTVATVDLSQTQRFVFVEQTCRKKRRSKFNFRSQRVSGTSTFRDMTSKSAFTDKAEHSSSMARPETTARTISRRNSRERSKAQMRDDGTGPSLSRRTRLRRTSTNILWNSGIILRLLRPKPIRIPNAQKQTEKRCGASGGSQTWKNCVTRRRSQKEPWIRSSLSAVQVSRWRKPHRKLGTNDRETSTSKQTHWISTPHRWSDWRWHESCSSNRFLSAVCFLLCQWWSACAIPETSQARLFGRG